MSKSKVFRFKGWDCYVKVSAYANNHVPALVLLAANTPHNAKQDIYPDEPIATASVNLEAPLVPLGKNETFIKDYSENEGMLKALIDAGIVEDTGETEATGWVEVSKVKILI